LSGASAGLRYNALGQRVQLSGAKTKHYTYDLGNRYLMVKRSSNSGSSELRFEYIWLDDIPIAQIYGVYGAGGVALKTTYIHADHLNTPRAMTAANRSIVWRWDGDAFGYMAPNSDADNNGVIEYLNLRFPGQMYDAETGFFHNGFRDYDPAIGRYLQSDPIGLAAGINTYSYVGNDPIAMIDPLGLLGGGGLVSAPRVTGAGVFGCMIGCIGFVQGDPEPQVSIEPALGGGIEICTKPKVAPKIECDEEPKDCGMYDPNCDNKWQAGLPVKPDKFGLVLGVSIKEGGEICAQVGLFISLPLPSVDLGGISE
jgi:RHS repeat-associated protein